MLPSGLKRLTSPGAAPLPRFPRCKIADFQIDEVTKVSAFPSANVLIEAAGVAGVTAVAYASTNFDNLVVLSAYGAKPGYRPLFVKLAFVCVCLIVLLVSYALANSASHLPIDKIRYLSLIPIGLGCYHLFKLFFSRTLDTAKNAVAAPASITFSAYMAFALMMLANSSDTVSILTPIFADLKLELLLVCFGAAVATALFMSAAAGYLAQHPISRFYLERFAEWALAFLLIGIGLLVFLDKPADVWIE